MLLGRSGMLLACRHAQFDHQRLRETVRILRVQRLPDGGGELFGVEWL